MDSITPNSSSVHQGDNFSFSYIVKDIGSGAVNTASWVGIFLDGQPTTLFGGTSTSGWNHLGPMAAGASITALDSFSTAGLSLGDHTLTIKADYWNDTTGNQDGNNDVFESDETNNSTTIDFTVTPAPARLLLGVDLAGAEFAGTDPNNGSVPGTVPGVYNKDYTYPTHAEIDYYASKGLGVIRLPFLWERLQHSELAALDPGAQPPQRRGELCDQQGPKDRDRAARLRLRFWCIDRKRTNAQLGVREPLVSACAAFCV